MDKIQQHLVDPDWWFAVIVGILIAVVSQLLVIGSTEWWSRRRREAMKERTAFEEYLSGMGDDLTKVPELLGPMLQLASVWRSRAWGLAGNALTGLVALVLAELLIIPRNWITGLITTGVVVILNTAIYRSLREAARNERVIDRCAHALRQIATSPSTLDAGSRGRHGGTEGSGAQGPLFLN